MAEAASDQSHEDSDLIALSRPQSIPFDVDSADSVAVQSAYSPPLRTKEK